MTDEAQCSDFFDSGFGWTERRAGDPEEKLRAIRSPI
jgi:hypothetical protein